MPGGRCSAAIAHIAALGRSSRRHAGRGAHAAEAKRSEKDSERHPKDDEVADKRAVAARRGQRNRKGKGSNLVAGRHSSPLGSSAASLREVRRTGLRCGYGKLGIEDVGGCRIRSHKAPKAVQLLSRLLPGANPFFRGPPRVARVLIGLRTSSTRPGPIRPRGVERRNPHNPGCSPSFCVKRAW